MDTKSNPTPTKHKFTAVQTVQRLGAVLITFPVYLQTTTSAEVSANRRRGGAATRDMKTIRLRVRSQVVALRVHIIDILSLIGQLSLSSFRGR